jgi:quercetin dioxygenase-like cupin family protein
MTAKLRRVVTGHDDKGRAIIMIDEQVQNTFSHRAGAEFSVIWSTEGFPIDNEGSEDPANGKIPTAIENGTVFRIVSFAPGVAPRNHRTSSIDYGVVMQGEIDMIMDDGVSVTLRAGDVLVQRGTIHDWVNNGTEPCVIAFSLIAAKPVTANGKPLLPQG